MASPKKSARRRERRNPSDFIQFIALSIVAGFVTAGLLIPPAATAGLTASASINWFKGLPSDLSDGPLSGPSTFLTSDGKTLATFYSENREEVSLDQISPNMVNAQLAIEDDSFYEHGGVDAFGIGRAVLNNLVHPGTRQGASTITQQYVNNLLIDQATQKGADATSTMGANKGMLDKIKEMKLAISMEQNKSKDEILNGYLNIVNYGGSNYGVQAASQYYWGKDAKDLNIQQSALLAGMVQSPTYYDPEANPKAATNRRNTVLHSMLIHNKITEAQYEEAKAAPLDLDIHHTNSGCTAATDAPYFCDYVRNEFTQDERFGANSKERLAKLTRGGLTIKTTLKSKDQQTAQDQVNQTQPTDNNPDSVSTSLVSVEPGTGNILSMAQNSNYNNGKGVGNTVYNYNVDSQMGGTPGFQPGSTFKAFSLTQWIKEGNGVDATIDASPLSYPAGTKWRASCKPGGSVVNPGANGAWSFQNAETGYNHPMTVNEGIYNSINSALYAMDNYLDLCGVGQTAADLGVVKGDESRGRINTEDSLASLIGTENVAPMAMANAFATYAAEGKYCAPRSITEVTDRSGKKLDVAPSSCHQAVDPDVARGVNYVLKNVLTKGSAYNRGIGLENASAAKTGTTDNSTQTWTVGYTRGVSTASWVGNVDLGSRSLNGLRINGQTKDYVDGSTYAGKQWQNYMQAVARDYNTDAFTNPSDKVVNDQIKSKKAD
ncbi:MULTISPECIES: transglycosylase domain-containing protein [Kocuria]|uniref:transglycosylase domain-containing protein n=1 Tax=Kocuria TaxID=57493 RepID=UPI0006608E06|nr:MULTISPECIES: transglycosylase domain-containing protein [Kocuria]MCT1367936.1 transglycosylase domain-containing protein [Rothia sp. p3-SID1597]RUQ23280.1 penicillin-binding protein [Kocuria sp. HSID16901]